MQNCEQGGLQAGSLQCYTQTQLLSFHGQYNNTSVAAAVSRSLHRSLPRSDAFPHFKVSSTLLQESCLWQQILFPQNQFSICDLSPSHSKEFLLHILMYRHSPTNLFFKTCHRPQRTMSHNNSLLH